MKYPATWLETYNCIPIPMPIGMFSQQHRRLISDMVASKLLVMDENGVISQELNIPDEFKQQLEQLTMKTYHVLAIEKNTVLYEIKASSCDEAMDIYHGNIAGKIKHIGSSSKTPSLECIEIGSK